MPNLELKLIPPGANGLTVKYIVTFIGQGKIYLRPIQQDLSLRNNTNQLINKSDTSKERCKNCDVPIGHFLNYVIGVDARNEFW